MGVRTTDNRLYLRHGGSESAAEPGATMTPEALLVAPPEEVVDQRLAGSRSGFRPRAWTAQLARALWSEEDHASIFPTRDSATRESLDPEVQLAMKREEWPQQRSLIPWWYKAVLVWGLSFGACYQLTGSVVSGLLVSAPFPTLYVLASRLTQRLRQIAFLLRETKTVARIRKSSL